MTDNVLRSIVCSKVFLMCYEKFLMCNDPIPYFILLVLSHTLKVTSVWIMMMMMFRQQINFVKFFNY